MPTPSAALDHLFGAPKISTTLPWAHRLVRAMRIAGMESLHDGNPQPRLVELLGCHGAATAFRLLLAGMGHVWPDRLVVFRPCCPRLTHDECALLAMVYFAGRNDLRGFDAHFADMLGSDARCWLFTYAQRLAAALPH